VTWNATKNSVEGPLESKRKIVNDCAYNTVVSWQRSNMSQLR
jgi:hypothetical protein